MTKQFKLTVRRSIITEKTILVVDDTIVDHKILSMILEREGYHVLHAMNGFEALQIMQDGSSCVSIVLLDYYMPVMNGFELLQQMNETGLINSIPVIVLTGDEGSETEIKCLEESMIGDELRVNQILMNLLSNAIKFTPANGEIDLMILQASRSQDKVQIRFSVSDTGCGMSEEMMGRLFNPFEQESASTARKHGGSGLELSITKKLTEMMGGSIKVQSAQGKGSVFTVDLPFKVSNNGSVTEMKNTDFSEIHALIVDDNKDSCEYCGVLLERLGVKYEYVLDGEAALEALEEAEDSGEPYDLCLIDWKMSNMNGGELTKQIREIFGNDTLVIIVSAYDLNELESNEHGSSCKTAENGKY